MSNRILDSQIQSRNDTAANWSSVNPVLLKGEIGIEIDTRKMKVGDGTSAWNDLKYLKDDIVIASANPATTDKDYDLGEFWLNQTDKTFFVMVAKTESAAEWKRIPNADELVVVAEAQTAQKLKTARSISIIGDATGATTFDGSADASITLVLKNSGASAGTYTKVTVNEKGLITKTELLTAEDIPALTLAKITDAGTAAARDVGTAQGNLVEVGANGKIPDSVLPPLAITEPHAVANETEMLALDAQVGDIAIRADEGKSYILKQTPASTIGNWLELKSPECKVLSVNGKTGAVVLTTSDIAEGTHLYYTEERASANFQSNYKAASSTDLTDGDTILHATDTLVLNGGNA